MLTAMLYCKIVLCCNVIIFSLFFFRWASYSVIKSVHQVHTTPCEEQTNIHDRLYNNNSDYARNTKSYITTITPNKNQEKKQVI